MAKRDAPLWLRRTAAELVAQWAARRPGTQWCGSTEEAIALERRLCLELVLAIAERIPDRLISTALMDLWKQAQEADHAG